MKQARGRAGQRDGADGDRGAEARAQGGRTSRGWRRERRDALRPDEGRAGERSHGAGVPARSLRWPQAAREGAAAHRHDAAGDRDPDAGLPCRPAGLRGRRWRPDGEVPAPRACALTAGTGTTMPPSDRRDAGVAASSTCPYPIPSRIQVATSWCACQGTASLGGDGACTALFHRETPSPRRWPRWRRVRRARER
jgi:hypothetical protein